MGTPRTAGAAPRRLTLTTPESRRGGRAGGGTTTKTTKTTTRRSLARLADALGARLREAAKKLARAESLAAGARASRGTSEERSRGGEPEPEPDAVAALAEELADVLRVGEAAARRARECASAARKGEGSDDDDDDDAAAVDAVALGLEVAEKRAADWFENLQAALEALFRSGAARKGAGRAGGDARGGAKKPLAARNAPRGGE